MTSPVRPKKQEQEAASDEITEVAPGVLRLQLPISLPGLGHVNCYALEDARGVALVDPGLPHPGAWRALRGRLAAAGFPVRRVHTVVVTHSHPDHYGGANRLRRASGAEVVSHRLFRNWWDPGDDVDLDEVDADPGGDAKTGPSVDGSGRPVPTAVAPGGRTPWGGVRPQPPLGGRWRRAVLGPMLRRWFATPQPTARLDDADRITLAGREWVAVHTPGHTPDHLCLLDPSEGVLLSGDHVLPTITPHISGIGAGSDPLARFFGSLERMHTLDGVTTVLPAHGHPFTDLVGRVDAIRDHHHQRLDTLRRASASLGPATVADLSHELFRPQVWGPMAESETYAHLEHLRQTGEVVSRDDHGTLHYAPVE